MFFLLDGVRGVGGGSWADMGVAAIVGSEGAPGPAKTGMTGALDDTKRKAEELVGKGS